MRGLVGGRDRSWRVLIVAGRRHARPSPSSAAWLFTPLLRRRRAQVLDEPPGTHMQSIARQPGTGWPYCCPAAAPTASWCWTHALAGTTARIGVAAMKKADLATPKSASTCGRPFTWRRKWARNVARHPPLLRCLPHRQTPGVGPATKRACETTPRFVLSHRSGHVLFV